MNLIDCSTFTVWYFILWHQGKFPERYKHRLWSSIYWSIVCVALKHCTNRILLKFFSKWFQIFQNNLKVITLIFTPYSSVFTVNFEHVIPDWMQISWNLRLHIKHGIPKISCCNMFYFFGYAHSKYVKCLFTNIQKKRILKIVYFYKQKNLTIK